MMNTIYKGANKITDISIAKLECVCAGEYVNV